jgi:Holliday junction DNA helicase RuvA
MYDFIKGKLVEKNPAFVVLENNGIGYICHISLNTFSAIGDQPHVRLFTHLSIREDAHTLYGFYEEAERALFLQLVSVSGVGSNTARLILSALTTAEAIEAIATEQVNKLQSVKGIGAKTAQRIVVDLRDKVVKVSIGSEKMGASYNTVKAEALSGLLILGFNKVSAEKVLDKLLRQQESPTVELLIKEALKML